MTEVKPFDDANSRVDTAYAHSGSGVRGSFVLAVEVDPASEAARFFESAFAGGSCAG